MTRVSGCFYNSADPQSIISAVLVKIKYPTTTFYDINGLNGVAVTALCNGLTNASFHDIYVVCDKTASQFGSFVVAGDISILDTKLIAITPPPQDPVPDAATQDYSAQDNGLIAPNRKLRPRILFEALWPNKPVAKLVALLGGYLLSVGDQAKSVQAYLGIRSANSDLTDAQFLQTLKDAIDENSRLNLDTTTESSYPQDIDAVNTYIANGVVVQGFIAATGVTLPEAPIVVP